MVTNRFAAASSWYLAGNITRRAMAFLLLPLYVHFLSPADFGLIELIDLTVQTASITIGLVAAGGAMIRIYYDYDDPTHRREVVSSAIIGAAGLGALLTALGCLAASRISAAIFSTPRYATLIEASFAGVLLSTIVELGLVHERLLGRARTYVFFSVAQSLLQLLLNVYFIAYLHSGVWGFIWSKIICAGVGATYFLIRLTSEVGWHCRLEPLKRMCSFGGPLIFSGASFLIIHFSDRFFLTRAVSLEQIGIYSIAYKFGFLVTYLVGEPFNRVWGVSLYHELSRPDWKFLFARVTRYYLLVLCTAGFVLAGFSDLALHLVTPAAYTAATIIIPIVVFAYVLREAGDFFLGLLYVNKRSGMISAVGLASASVNLSLNALLIPPLGITGAAWSTFATWTFYVCVSWVCAKHEHCLPLRGWDFVRLCALTCLVFLPSYWKPRLSPLSRFGWNAAIVLVYAIAVLCSGYINKNELREVWLSSLTVLRRMLGLHWVQQLKNRITRALYASGGLGVFHHWRNRSTLTVVAFHRVLPAADIRAATADPAWTISDTAFDKCLGFFQRHYNVVGIPEVIDHLFSGRRLPPRALLITLDDGWADNADVALVFLRRRRLSAAIFVTTDGIGNSVPWHDTILREYHAGRITDEAWNTLRSATRFATACRTDAHPVLAALGAAPAEVRNQIIHNSGVLNAVQIGAPLMATADQLRMLHHSGIYIGSHGHTHTPLTYASSPEQELCLSQDTLAGILGAGARPIAFSFPHGKYNERILQLALSAGYKVIFTSDAVLNPTPLVSVLGRIAIGPYAVSDSEGRFCPERMAFWLFFRPKAEVHAVGCQGQDAAAMRT